MLLETMRGIQALLFVATKWKKPERVDSITEAWAMDNDAPKTYQAGTGTRCLGGDDYP
ncbi:hypothetical protein ACLB1T_29870 [Escherichia coli]